MQSRMREKEQILEFGIKRVGWPGAIGRNRHTFCCGAGVFLLLNVFQYRFPVVIIIDAHWMV